MLYNLKMYIKPINGKVNTETISSLDITNPGAKVIALNSKVETEVELKVAA
jgi:hypothetical protein